MAQLPALPAMIEALLTSRAYPEPEKITEQIELIQTHISYVLLTDTFAYKIKKPVDFGFLDFTTIEKRRHFCNEEVRLNRRLAPSLYIGVVEVTQKDGLFSIDGAEPGSAVIDYAVKMKRIPEGTTLEELIENSSVTPEIVCAVAERIARFHYQPPGTSKDGAQENTAFASTDERIAAFGALEVIQQNTEENFRQTKSFIGTLIPEKSYGFLHAYTENFLGIHANLFKSRVTGGFIRDCHGDIHAEHVLITEDGTVEIFDCIEFSERFRFSDTVAEIAFLSMDLDFRGRAGLAKTLEQSYFNATGDFAGRHLLNFYKTYRAYIRGKVEGFKYNATEVPEEERAAALFNARHHFYLAQQYAGNCIDDCVPARLIVVRGLSGTGKSRIAHKVARLLGATLISSDRVRKELAGVVPSEHKTEEFERGIYSPDFTLKTYKELHSRAKEILDSGLSCVLDATYCQTEFIEEARALTAQDNKSATECPFHVIETTASEEIVLKRIEKRAFAEAAPGSVVSDAGADIYQQQKALFVPLDSGCAIIDTSLGECEVLKLITTEIFG